MNVVNLVGRLGKDVEMQQAGDFKVAKFTLATAEGKDKTEWHFIEAWEKTAELCQKYLSKGSQVAIEGRIKTDISEKNGEKRYYTKIVANRVEFLSSKNDTNATKEGKHPGLGLSGFSDDNIPF